MLHKSALELIGNTPIVRLKRLEKLLDLEFEMYAKLEYANPMGSVKDRLALALVKDALEKGLLSERPEENGGKIWVEATSGNTGIGLAFLSNMFGFRLIITMPDTMSAERRFALAYLGAEVVLTPGKKGMAGACEAAIEIAEATGGYRPDQFKNPANPLFHYQTTGPEIYRQMEGRVDAFVAGYGTGGTISGAGKYLKEMNPECLVVTVEPEESPVLSNGKTGPHGIQGIGPGFVPDTLNTEILDRIVTVKSEEAIEMSRKAARLDGIFCGISAGANLAAAVKLKDELKGKRVAVIIPDTGERYLSTEPFRSPEVQQNILSYEDWRKKHGFADS